MMNLVRHLAALSLLWFGLSGMLLGFEIWIGPMEDSLHSEELILPNIAVGLFSWWLGCRLAIPSGKARAGRA